MVQHANKVSFGTKCLFWQYEELLRNPLGGVNARPLEKDIFEWHGNFYFSDEHEHFPGMVIHFVLTLPQDYPNGVPDMRLLTPFPHSHVFGGTICFSLLTEFQLWFEDQNLPSTAFWNPSRTIRSLLESLYIFLTVDEDKHVSVSRHGVDMALRSSEKCRCSSCGHHPSSGKVWPPEEDWLASKNDSELEEQASALAMHEDLLGKPAAKPAAKPAPKLAPRKARATAPPAKAVVVDISAARKPVKILVPAPIDMNTRAVMLKEEARCMVASAPSAAVTSAMDKETLGDFRCSMTGVTFDHSDSVVLGFGVKVERREKDGSILSITTDLIPISLQAFLKGRIRKSALGNDFSHFFPFAINELHWAKARRVLPGCVEAILRGPEERNLSDDPGDRLLFVIGELWKSMAVLMMKGDVHASEKVLKGFCALHHILLLASEEADPLKGAAASHAGEISNKEKLSASEAPEWTVVVKKKRPVKDNQSAFLKLANKRVNAFVRNPRDRHKARCPDFGRFLPLILLSDLSWREIGEPFLHELLARNARWVLQVHPELRHLGVHETTGAILTDRAAKSWGASATGLQITAFQIWFALNVYDWARRALPRHVADAYQRTGNRRLLVRAMYEVLGGRPTKDMMATFQQQTKAIEAMGQYQDFFQTVEMPLSCTEIQVLLCEAMKRSERCRYHW